MHRASLARAHAHTWPRVIYESYECARAYFWDKELCKHEFTSGGHYCPGPGASYPSGTSLVQSFLLVTLPVTSTSMRYDRYDTCLHVCLRGPRPLRASASRIATRRTGDSARTGALRFRRDAPSSARELYFTEACEIASAFGANLARE